MKIILKFDDLISYYYHSHDRLEGVDYFKWVKAQGGVKINDFQNPYFPNFEISEEDLIILKLKYGK